MTSFIGINVAQRTLIDIKAASLAVAEASMGLAKVDHGILVRDPAGRSLGYVVAEFGWFMRPAMQHYAEVCGRAIAGNAVVYAFDVDGSTIDATADDLAVLRGATRWLPHCADVELAIAAGRIQRPTMAVNGEVLWQWPDPPPADLAAAMGGGRPR